MKKLLVTVMAGFLLLGCALTACNNSPPPNPKYKDWDKEVDNYKNNRKKPGKMFYEQEMKE